MNQFNIFELLNQTPDNSMFISLESYTKDHMYANRMITGISPISEEILTATIAPLGADKATIEWSDGGVNTFDNISGIALAFDRLTTYTTGKEDFLKDGSGSKWRDHMFYVEDNNVSLKCFYVVEENGEDYINIVKVGDKNRNLYYDAQYTFDIRYFGLRKAERTMNGFNFLLCGRDIPKSMFGRFKDYLLKKFAEISTEDIVKGYMTYGKGNKKGEQDV